MCKYKGFLRRNQQPNNNSRIWHIIIPGLGYIIFASFDQLIGIHQDCLTLDRTLCDFAERKMVKVIIVIDLAEGKYARTSMKTIQALGFPNKEYLDSKVSLRLLFWKGNFEN